MQNRSDNLMLSNVCRQCNTSIVANADFCPLCGLSKPNEKTLTSKDKELFHCPPLIPAKLFFLETRIETDRSYGSVVISELAYYLNDFKNNQFFLFSFLSVIFGGSLLLLEIFFPLSFMLFWLGAVCGVFDLVIFFRTLNNVVRSKKLQHSVKGTPYSVHFKLETQIKKSLSSLQLLIFSCFEKLARLSDEKKLVYLDSFFSAISIILQKIQNLTEQSLKVVKIIWCNNLYSIIALKITNEEKIIAINNKIREAEAFIMRYVWLKKIPDIKTEIKDYVNNMHSKTDSENYSAGKEIIDKYYLSTFGPLSEPYSGDFEHTPYQLQYITRHFWHSQLPPFELASNELTKEYPQLIDFIEGIEQVRNLRNSLEEQMLLDCSREAISHINSDVIYDNITSLEADDIALYDNFYKHVDVPKFLACPEEFTKEVDKLKSHTRATRRRLGS